METEILAGLLDLAEAGALRTRLLARIEAGAAISLDARAVERLTTPCVQVLLAAASAAAAAGQEFRVVSPSRAFAEGIALLGLTPSTASWITP